MDDEPAGRSTPEGAPEAAPTQVDSESEAEVGAELRGTEPEPGLLAEEEAGVIAPSREQEPEAWKPRLLPWAPRDPGGANLGRLETVVWDEAAARLMARDAAGATLLIQPLGPATLRVTLLAPGAAAPPASFAVLPEALTAPPTLPAPPAGESGPLVEAAEGWTVATSAGPLTLGREGNLRWARDDGEVIQVTGPGPGDKLGFGWGAEWTWVWLVRNQGGAYLGFGERTGALDRGGLQMTFWTADVGPHHPGTDAMYQCLPVGLVWDPGTGHTTGLFSDYPGLQRWDLGQTEAGAICVAANAPLLDLYLFAGPTMPDVLAQYTALTGRMPLPPRWALGFQQSRWSYFPQSQVLDVAREFRRRNLPADVLYLDIDYMRGFRDFTFDPRGFPDPAAMTAEAADLGFRIVTILDPGVKRDRGYPVYDEMFRRQYYVKWTDGRPYVGKVWPGPCVFPDFFQQAVRDWWGGLHARLLDVGIAGIWDDMNEPAVTNEQPTEGSAPDGSWDAGTMPPDVIHETISGIRPHRAVHSAYGLHMARATAEGLDRLRPGERRFVLTRSGYAGVQRYAAVWTGDNQSWWEHLAMAVSMCQGMGLAGVAFVGTDIGGFNERTTGELYLRWLQFGTVMPLARAHYNLHNSGGQEQEPWSFGPAIEAHARVALEQRYRLLPYLYSLFWEAAQTGAPVLRPLAWDFPYDPRGRSADTEALCGPALLAAPVTRAGQAAQAVYLPPGYWYHLVTRTCYTGGQDVLVPTPLEHWPLFVRDGSVIPLGESARNTDDAAGSPVTLLVTVPAPASTPRPPFVWYEDNGQDLAYRVGDFRQVPLQCRREDSTVVVEIGPVSGGRAPNSRDLHLEVWGLDSAPGSVQVNGSPAAGGAWDAESRRLTLPLDPPGEGSQLRITLAP